MLLSLASPPKASSLMVPVADLKSKPLSLTFGSVTDKPTFLPKMSKFSAPSSALNSFGLAES